MDIRDNKGRFVLGRNAQDEPIEYKIKRSQSLKESWKNRDDYIMDLVTKNPKIYNSWRAIRTTQKGKKAGNEPRWDNFRLFYEDVSKTYKEGLILRRKDKDKEWSRDNFIWIRKEDEYLLNKNRVIINFNGISLTLREWSEKEQIPYSAIKNRYYKREKYNYTNEEIIFGRKTKRDTKKPKDYRDSLENIRTKASKMISSYKCKDKRLGFKEVCDIDTDWMIENILTKPCVYCGDNKRVGCDRIDNSKGHTKDNVVPCCIECNHARNNNFTHEEMFEIGKAIRSVKSKRNA